MILVLVLQSKINAYFDLSIRDRSICELYFEENKKYREIRILKNVSFNIISKAISKYNKNLLLIQKNNRYELQKTKY